MTLQVKGFEANTTSHIESYYMFRDSKCFQQTNICTIHLFTSSIKQLNTNNY